MTTRLLLRHSPVAPYALLALVAAAATLALVVDFGGDRRASAAGTTPDLYIQVPGIAGCTTNNPADPPDTVGEVVCNVGLGASFALGGFVSSIAGLPDADSDPGYAGFQFRLQHTSGLTLNNPAGTDIELGFPLPFWPDCLGARADAEAFGQYDINCLTAGNDESTFLGKLIELSYTCTTPGQNALVMNDAASFLYDETLDNVIDKHGTEILTIACSNDPAPTATPTPTPTPKNPDADTDADTVPNSADDDDDGDGCTDMKEIGLVEELGGLRDPHNFWDFFDVWTGGPSWVRNKAVAAPDFFGVLGRFGTTRAGGVPTKAAAFSEALVPPSSSTGYHAAFDRGPAPMGADPWDLTTADGAIAGPDFFRVLAQFGHSCA